MGPKAKGKKDTKKEVPTIDPDEVVTELMKEFFEIQLADIDKKLDRLSDRQEVLKSGVTELEEKIEECKKEKGAIINEHEETLAMKEEEKIKKREEMIWLTSEVKTRVENHKKHIEKLEEKYNEMVTELTAQIETLEEEVRILEEHKQNKDIYNKELDEIEKKMEEEEMQHQRNLFQIEGKWIVAKARMKKELESTLLQLSIEFQEVSQKKTGKAWHRITEENKVIQNELKLMREELIVYKDKYLKSKSNVIVYKNQQQVGKMETDKEMARTIIQVVLIKALLKNRMTLFEELKKYHAVDTENKILVKKLRTVLFEIERKIAEMREIRRTISEKIEEANAMSEASTHLRRTTRRLQVLIRNSLKVAEEAMAVQLIPMGGTEEEKFMNSDAKIRLFKKRRDAAFLKKGRILQYLLDNLAKGVPTEEDKKLLRSSAETFDLELMDFGQIYGMGASGGEKDLQIKEQHAAMVHEDESLIISLGSEPSLPRSVSKILEFRLERAESLEGEFEEEEYEGEFSETEGVKKEPVTMPIEEVVEEPEESEEDELDVEDKDAEPLDED